MKISAVINTSNEEKNIARCLKSIAAYVDEIVIVDMHSSDKTRVIARTYTKKIYLYEPVGYVEPARNFAIHKASGDWILLVDADEVVPETLGLKLRRLIEHVDYSFYRIPRKNLIFSKWIEHSGWWPDFKIRLFRKNHVTWSDEIHSVPITQGKGMDLQVEEKNALIHYHYESIYQFIERLNRYTNQEAKQLLADNYICEWKNFLLKPSSEFIKRFFVWEGYKDGLHGLSLSLLQAVSFFVVELKVWETQKFTQEAEINLPVFMQLFYQIKHDVLFWYAQKRKTYASLTEELINTLRVKLNL